MNKAVQEPNFYRTPIVQRGKVQTSGDHVFSYSTPVMQIPGLQTVDSSVNMHQSAHAPFTPMVQIPVPPNVSMNQPVFGYSSTFPPAVFQMNGIPVCSNFVNPTNPIFFNGKGLNRGLVIFMANEDRQTNEPLLYTNQGTDVQILTGSTVLSQFTSNSQSQSQREMMHFQEQRNETDVYSSKPHVNQEAQNDGYRNTTVSGSPEFTCRPFMPLVESHDKMEVQQRQSSYDQVIQHKTSEGGNNSVYEETLLNIIRSIKNLESL